MLTSIDLFSGPGGLCTGFKAAGIMPLIAVEWSYWTAQTYAATHNADILPLADYLDNPDEYKKYNAQSIESAIYHFFRPANSPGFNQHDDYLDGYYPYEQQKDALVIWNEFYDEAKKHILPSTLPYKEEEINRMNEIKASNCTNNFDAAINDIIMCKKSLNDYESCVKKAKKEGYDELTKIHQAAYDRYLSAIK